MPSKSDAAVSYSEILQDPRWQQKRLLVFQREDFRCDNCGDGDKTLHVNYLGFEWGKDLWDYELEDQRCLCKNCPANATRAQKALTRFVNKLSAILSAPGTVRSSSFQRK
jgi:hypothetical protein